MQEQVVERSAEVKASPQDIWRELIAAPAWPEWKPFVTRVSIVGGYPTLAIGSRFKMSLVIGGPAALPLTAVVIDFQPGARLLWTGGVPGWFYAEHSFDLADLGGGVTRVTSRERFTGRLLPVVFRIVTREDMEKLHGDWVRAIKERMEGKAEPAAADSAH